MNYKHLLLTAVITTLFISCEKENFQDYRNHQNAKTFVENTQHCNRRGNDEELIGVNGIVSLDNGKQAMSGGIIKVFDVKDQVHVLQTVTGESGSFSFNVKSGSYIIECYNEDQLLGTSGELQVEKNITVNLNF